MQMFFQCVPEAGKILTADHGLAWGRTLLRLRNEMFLSQCFFWSTYLLNLGGGPDPDLNIKSRWPYRKFLPYIFFCSRVWCLQKTYNRKTRLQKVVALQIFL